MKQKLLFFSISLISLILFSNIVPVKSQENFQLYQKNSVRFYPGNRYRSKMPSPSLKDKEEHEPEKLEIPDGQAVPTVDLIVHQDAQKGWNLEIQVTNFKFAPETVNQNSSLNEGHAHLYINGKKITRIYGNWYYLPQLEPGRNNITISLNTNSHETLIYKGKVVEDTEIIEVK
jgi:hypothetical protein